MDGASTLLALGPALVALALVDSLSVGTLAVPVWLLLAPGRPRPGRILTYLAALALFYVGVGLVLLAGADALVATLDVDWQSPPAMRVLFLAGAALLGASFVVHPPGGSTRPGGGNPRLRRWRAAAAGADDTGRASRPRALVGLALAVGLVEVGTMLPYLAAIGLLTGTDRPFAVKALVLAGYCVVMVLPAVVLVVARRVAAPLLDPLLRRLDRWFAAHGGEALGWILGIVGVVLMGRNLPAVMELFGGV
ncbi:GAP family protein [Phycicoccus flavus]|uniref:GAP family protein n=1 Tax=Phycicoccus flavus TaxID=2502783 RepID=UPI000FEBFA0D|nr:GAP family protein [Phycicoccus flavus]NHA67000.1 GAP family protein [Phycicoccus flavus]